MRRTVFSIVFTVLIVEARSQQSTTSGQEKKPTETVSEQVYLSSAGLNRLVNAKFNSLVTGNATGTQVANFASFDPANGSFVFKGTMPLSRSDDKAKFAYLSLRMEGDLISDSYAALFTNTALNTNAVIDGQLHFRLSNHLTRIRYLGSDDAVMQQKKEALSKEKDAKWKKLSATEWDKGLKEELDALNEKRNVMRQRLVFINELQKQRTASINGEASKAKPDYATIKKLSDENMAAEKEQQETNATIGKLTAAIDSVQYIQKQDLDFLIIKRNEVVREYNTKLEAIESNAKTSAFQFGWFTITAGASKKNYYTFYDSLRFANQLTKRELSTFRFGVSWNFYQERSFPQRVLYLNIGFLRYQDNNLKFLSTQEVSQSKTIKNAAGDTVRTISKKYNAYTDAITESSLWNFFTNIYFIHSSRTAAFHLFPSVDLYEDNKALANVGLGYVVSFKNEKKDKPVINAEGYIKFVDLFNQLDGKLRFWKRNEIGVSFTLPFNFFIQ